MIRVLIFLVVTYNFVNTFDLKTLQRFNKRLTINGGKMAVPHAYPYQVGLIIDGTQFCGGSLISKNYILTAAHCAVQIVFSVDIILGAHNITRKEVTQAYRTSSNIIIHEEFNDMSYQNDIALIKLDRPVVLTAAIRTIPLLSQYDADKTFVGETVTSTGWGLIKDVFNPTIRDMSSVLRVVNVTVMDVEKCGDYYNDDYFNIVYITENNICTSGVDKKGTCNGDSGGPLVLNGIQIGVVSAGTELCEIGAPSVFTHIGNYLDWIQLNSDVLVL